MTTARWSDNDVRHGGCLLEQAAATLPGRRGQAVVRGDSRASMKSFIEDRDGRRFGDRIMVVKGKNRRGKVERLRRQIKDGTYDVNWRLATILDKMVEDIAAQIHRGERP